MRAKVWLSRSNKGAAHMQVGLVGMDTSKAVFTVHCVDASGAVVLRRDIRRGGLEAFFGSLAPTVVALEACGGSHHWARVLTRLGHRARLIAPHYVKPYVRRGKSERADAEAICEAASRPSARFVPVRSAEHQGRAMILGVRDLLVRQRTQAINALRGHAAEFGVVAGRGTGRVAELLGRVEQDAGVPEEARAMLAELGEAVAALDARIEGLDGRLREHAKGCAVARRLAAVPGIGPIAAASLSLGVEASCFASGRHFAAWLGLVPRQCSTGGRPKLGRISKAGHERLRQLLVLGATAVIAHARPGKASAWLLGLLERRPRKLAAVALANKMARIV